MIPGVDGRKMSKSYGNTIGLFDEGKDAQKEGLSIVTDSTPLEDPKDPDADHDRSRSSASSPTDAQRDEIADAYRAGGYGYGHAKKALAGHDLGPLRPRRASAAPGWRSAPTTSARFSGPAPRRPARARRGAGRVREAVGFLNP